MDNKTLEKIAEMNQTNKIEAKKKSRIEILRTLLFVFLALIIVLIVRIFIGPCTIVGDSMNPTYHDNQLVMSHNKIFEPITNGDVIVFHNEFTMGEHFVKRVVGVAGDVLVINNGILYRNGEPAENFELIEDAGMLVEPYTVKKNEYFCIGDNRNNSYDSRKIGPVYYEDIDAVLFNGNINRTKK